jgi:DNA-binding MarR family transcriptional regulator
MARRGALPARSLGIPMAAKASPAKTDPLAQGSRWIDSFTPYLLYRVTNKLNAKLMGKLRAARVNASQWRVLSVLRAYGTLSMGEIVDSTLMEQPTVSRVVAQLEQEGRVKRRWSTHDSRVAEVTLTELGAEAFNQIHPTAMRHQALAFRGFSDVEIATLRDLLSRIEENIQDYD